MCKLLRPSVLIGLVALILSAGHCKERPETGVGLKERQNLLNLIMEIIQELKKYHLEEVEENGVQYKQGYPPLDQREMPDYGTYTEEQKVEIFPRDLRMKDKFLNHLTGPLYFGPKCTKHFHRLYHHTRDCTIPAYVFSIRVILSFLATALLAAILFHNYKRCARLLTRLAVSPMCTEG